MSNYNSENTTVLATHEQSDGNTRMLLLHKCKSGRLEYVIGSYFTAIAELPRGEVHEDGSVHGGMDGFASEKAFKRFWDKAIKSYSWQWGHYFNDVTRAVEYWESEVLRKPSARKMVLEDAWKRFGDTPIDDSDRITEPFWLKPSWSYPAGVSRFEIWDAFDELYAEWGGVHALAYPSEHQ